MALLNFPTFMSRDVKVERSSKYEVDEHEVISGIKQRDTWSSGPTYTWDITLNGLGSDVYVSGAWGVLPEPAALEWFWNFHTGSVGRFIYTDELTGTPTTASFSDSTLNQRQVLPGLWSATFRIESRK